MTDNQSEFQVSNSNQLKPLIQKSFFRDSESEADWEYISEQENFQEKVKRYDDALLKEGFSEGFKKGFEKGINESAKNGIKAGLDNAVIALMTKLTDEQIKKIRNDLTTT